LQVNLLTERRATQVVQMLDQLSAHLGVEPHHDHESRELGEPPESRVLPEVVEIREEAMNGLTAISGTDFSLPLRRILSG